MKRYLRYIASLLMVSCGLFPSVSADYGLRFKAHDVPANQRTSLNLGDKAYDYRNTLELSFGLGFYHPDRFGLICTLKGKDGNSIFLMSREKDGKYYPAIIADNTLHEPDIPFHEANGTIQPVRILLERKSGTIVLEYNGKKFSYPSVIAKSGSVEISFGWRYEQSTVAPMELQNVSVATDGEKDGFWELNTHNGDSVTDAEKGRIGITRFPVWIADEHRKWENIYSLRSADNIQSTFSVADSKFYIAASDYILIFDPLTGKEDRITLKADGRQMKYSNHLVWSAPAEALVSFDIYGKTASFYDIASGEWNNPKSNEEESRYYNCGYVDDGRFGYVFGGYGFHLYNNEFMKIDLESGQMETLSLTPVPAPRTSASLGITDEKLYIFGGYGNEEGKQEFPSTNYYDLWEYDLKTLKGHRIWEMTRDKKHFLPSSTMYYSSAERCFYFASTLGGGCMMRLYIDKPDIEIVSDPIHSSMSYRDCVFNLYKDESGKYYYLVIDKTFDDMSHDLAIYRIIYPFLNASKLNGESGDASDHEGSFVWWFVGFLSVIIGGCLLYFFIRHRKNISKNDKKEKEMVMPDSADQMNQEPESDVDEISEDNSPVVESDQDNSAADVSEGEGAFANDSQGENPVGEDHVADEPEMFVPEDYPPVITYFNRDRNAISMLGKFEMRDSEGNDLIYKMNIRMRAVLILLVHYSVKSERGVNDKVLDQLVWPDKDEQSARKNRNVCIYKMRSILEEAGDVRILLDKGYYKIDTESVFIDYMEALHRLSLGSVDNLTGEAMDQMLELLFFGPLLPGVTYDWLDDFKSEYSDKALDAMNIILEKKLSEGNMEVAGRLADAISRHDPLSETALGVKCRVLVSKDMKGRARELYDRFCKEYLKSYGEAYKIPFSELINQ